MLARHALRLTAVLSFVATPVLANPSPCRLRPGERPVAGVVVDTRHHLVIATQGPFAPPPMTSDDPAMEQMMQGMMMADPADTIVQRFAWPVNGWLRGFRLDACSPDGKAYPEEVLHHIVVVDLGRRQLWRPTAERLIGIGEETQDASVPRSVGAPLRAGTPLAIHVMWHNMTGKPIQVFYRLTLVYSPANEDPRPVSAMPVVFEASPDIGQLPTYDVPPGGRSVRTFDVTIPISGRVLAAGGHLHDYAESVGLVDVESGRTLFTVRARRAPDGHVTGVNHRLLAIRGRGVHLIAGRHYRVTAVYDNTTADTLRGVMAQLATIFAPDDPAAWPALDRSSPDYIRDLTSLKGMDVPASPVVFLGRCPVPAGPAATAPARGGRVRGCAPAPERGVLSLRARRR